MPASTSTFTTNPYPLGQLLRDCAAGVIQLPDFQRSWVWDEERIRSLIASVSRGFPIGALMTLQQGGEVEFKPRPVEGAPDSATQRSPEALLLDGQQRLTSLYQVSLRGQVVETVTPRRKRVKRWFYVDVRKALDPSVEREDAIVSVPEDRIIRSDFGRTIDLDLSTREREILELMYPVSSLFSWDEWFGDFVNFHVAAGDLAEYLPLIQQFRNEVLENLSGYHIPVIALGRTTSKEAVCTVFEKLNTGGKALDAFELITAMYAADGYQLRRDWYGEGDIVGRHQRFRLAHRLPSSDEGILSGVGNTDFLQVISLFHTRDVRAEAEAANRTGKELPQVAASRQALLNLPLGAYKRYQDLAEQGFMKAGAFLIRQGVYRVYDLPYQSQVAPLAAILAELGDRAEEPAVAEKVLQWYWNGVFGELYGSTTETRIARDFVEVLAWVSGGQEPSTVRDAVFRSDRLRTMRMRLSAAYKGVNALLLKRGARDFRTGQEFGLAVFFDENVDIHHVFPQDWCKGQGIPREVYDSIINKTPISARTNRKIGGSAPSWYLGVLEDEAGEQGGARIDGILATHLIDPDLLRADDFEGFMAQRQDALVALIERATGKPVFRELAGRDDPEVELEEDADEPA